MRILYIHQYFCTRAGKSGTRSYEFARHLVRNGHQVTMLTSTSDLSDLQLDPGQTVGRMRIEGIDVVAVRIAYSQKMNAGGRVWSFVRFMLVSAWLACRERGHDVVIATSTPLTVGIPGLLAAATHRIPLVFEVRDLWPEAPIQMGVLRNPVLIAALRAFERLVYRRSRHVIALSPGMRDGVEAAGTAPGKITVIPNCSDLDLFRPGTADPAVVARYGLAGYFVAAYAGSMGEANDVGVLIDAAARIQDEAPEVRFLLIGQGKQAGDVQAHIQARGIRNVVFAGSMPRQEVADVLRASHVCLVLFKDLPILATNSPNKLFDALAAGRPVIVNSNGWTRALVQENEAGLYAEPGSAASLAAQIVRLARDPQFQAHAGRNARRLAEAEFDRAKCAREFEQVLCAAAGCELPPNRSAHDREPGLHDVGADPSAHEIETGRDALPARIGQVPVDAAHTGR